MTEAAGAKSKHTTTMNGMSINWSDEKMQSVFANIGTATANREEFYFLFGTHQNWRGNSAETKKVDVDLTTRLVLNPYAAKRFAAILGASIKAYEDQFGKIDI